MASLPTLATLRRAPDDPVWTAAVASALDEYGCCVIEGAAAPETMDAIATELAAFQPVASVGNSDFEGHSTRRTGAPLPRSASFRSIALHPAVVAACDHVLGHATTWRFSAAEYIGIGPGETAQRLHRDAWKYDMVDFGCEVELNGMWAITDFTEANGATRVIPGSHRLAHDARPDPSDTVPAEMAKGSPPALHRSAVPRRRSEHHRRVAAGGCRSSTRLAG